MREKQGRSAKGGTATTGLFLENDTCEMRYIILMVLVRIRLYLHVHFLHVSALVAIGPVVVDDDGKLSGGGSHLNQGI